MHLIMVFLIGLSCFILPSIDADQSIWKGTVSADGTPTEPIRLEMHKKYIISVKGFVNLGKWIQGGEKLANDACFEFNPRTSIAKITALENSHKIPVCDGTYHLNHHYQSKPFVAKHNRIHFWVHDAYYDDNSGEFDVEIIEVTDHIHVKE